MMNQYTGVRNMVFNFAEARKILFGTMDDQDEIYYTDKISRLEREKLDFLKLSQEQISVVKSTLKSANSSLCTVLENERILSKGLEGRLIT